MRIAVLLALVLLSAAPARAQFGTPTEPCPPGTAEARLRGAEVEAALFTNGNLFLGTTTSNGRGYTVPINQTSPNGSPLSPLFATNLWIGGTVGGDLRTAAARYSGFQMRPGRTGEDGVPPTPEACAEADRIWMVSRQDIADYYAGGAPTADLAEWPVHLGAPVLDGDGVEGNYDLASGDQPAIRGDVTAFWAMTDTAAERQALYTEEEFPVGVDVTAEAFAFRQRLFGQHTFYRFTVTNRNRVPIDSAYVGLFNDFELGDTSDDYAGTDTTRQMVFVYNGQEADAFYGVPPAFGTIALNGPTGLPNGRDDDADGETDEPGERLGLTATSYFFEHSATADPNRPLQYYNYLAGLWADGSVKRSNGDGYWQSPSFPITPFAFTGDPVAGSYWSEVNNDGMGTGNRRGNRRGVTSTGPFRLVPGASSSVMFAYAFAQGADRFGSVEALRRQASGILAAEASGAFEAERVRGVLPQPLAVSRPRPNPFSGSTTVEVQGAFDTPVRVSVYDALGRRLSTTETSAPEARMEVGAELAPGVYIVRVEGLGFAETFTIVKAK